MVTGQVRKTGGGTYRVALDDGRWVEAALRGRLKHETGAGEKVVVGDRVRVTEVQEGGFVVEEMLPRRSRLVRRGPGGREPRVVAANLDRLCVVVAARRPDSSRELVDRLLVVGEVNELETVLVVNKMDLEGSDEAGRRLESLYGGIGYPVLLTSAVSGKGLEEFESRVCSGISALVGPSGAGKSTLLNAIEPELELRTGELSRRKGRGRHTTVSSRLLELSCGGMVADTPGFSDVGIWGVESAELEWYFPDFHPYLGECRFRGCSHLHEPDCAIRAAVEAGEIDEGRMESYRILREESEERKPWE